MVRPRYPLPNIGNVMSNKTSEIAAKHGGGMYNLVLVASARVRELKKGHAPKIVTKQGTTMTALQEIEEGHINVKDYLKKLK
jgi:DNA-directed RNA polymerase subunit K/omega